MPDTSRPARPRTGDPSRRRPPSRQPRRQPPRARGAGQRRLGVALTLAVAGLALVLILSNLGSARQQGSGHPGSRGGPTARRNGHPRARPPVRKLTTHFRAASVEITLDEPSSSAAATAHSSSGEPFRALPTVVRFPVAASGSAALAGAPFPMIVFSQGFAESSQAYAGLLDAWVRAGYVVAAPTYPFTDPSSPTGLNENDIVNHPGDLRFVIASLQRLARNPASRLHSVLDPNRVAVAGQSDGGDVSLAVAANSCCRDPAVRAAVILSGAELASLGGTYYSAGSVPLLVAQGSQDTINPPECSAQLYGPAPQPKYYLDIIGAEHLTPYVSGGPIRDGVERATIAFLNAYVKHGSAGLAALKAAARLPPEEQLTSAPAAPPPGGTYCPGAP